ncbi:MAG: hypothetical protein WA902_17385 [Thermosynechococcaceae cyanobacterium]
MRQSDFQAMSLRDLRAHILSNREDDEAFYVYVDRKQAQGTKIKHPPLRSVQDMENYPDVIDKLRQDAG